VKKKPRKLNCSPLAVLERIVHRKRVKFTRIQEDFPGVAYGVLFRAVATLHAMKLVRRRSHTRGALSGPGRKQGPVTYFWWRPTARGERLVVHLYCYRDFWDMLELRDIRAFAEVEERLERLDAMYKDRYPRDLRRFPRRDYWRRADLIG